MKYPIIFPQIILTTLKGFSQNTSDYSKLIGGGNFALLKIIEVNPDFMKKHLS
ncbi:MAG: hypothetical protein H2058_16765 [Muricauda sp.]|nr:hypothetical protein [Allomuricauda sp.]MBA4746894.1 hypothetical protein [Allomuricauda sp.]